MTRSKKCHEFPAHYLTSELETEFSGSNETEQICMLDFKFVTHMRNLRPLTAGLFRDNDSLMEPCNSDHPRVGRMTPFSFFHEMLKLCDDRSAGLDYGFVRRDNQKALSFVDPPIRIIFLPFQFMKHFFGYQDAFGRCPFVELSPNGGENINRISSMPGFEDRRSVE